MRKLLRGWARTLLDDELTVLHRENRQLTARVDSMRTFESELLSDARRFANKIRYLETKLRQTEQSERHQRAAASGAALLRLERELLRAWQHLTNKLDAEPVRDAATGLLHCPKVPLHSRKEAQRFARKVERDVNYPEQLEPYVCTICPPHPLVGRVWHVRHEYRSPLRGLSATERARLRADEPLTASVADHVPADVRTRLVQLLANDNGPTNWTPEAAADTAFVPLVGTLDANGTAPDGTDGTDGTNEE